MEKQTMGKFIAALRKANGMTQSDLAEKLCVSNKSVSKWECDDGYPDLSLIPIIAEIFGVTSDEILKGGRIIKDDNSISEQPKSEKQVNMLLQKTLTKFKNLSLIAVFLGVTGLIMACFLPFKPIVYSASTGVFYRILTLLSVIFVFASIILEIIFFNNAKSAIFDFDATDNKRILRARKTLGNWAFNIIVIDILILLGSIALLTIVLTLRSLLFLPALYIFAYIIKMLLSDKVYYNMDEQTQAKIRKGNIKFVIVSGVAFIIPLVIYFVAFSGYPFWDRLYPLIHSLIIAAIGLIFIFIRKKLLRNYSKI